MALKIEKVEQFERKPFFVQSWIVNDIQILYKGENSFSDIQLIITANNGKFDKKIYIGGNYKKDGDIIVDWGSAFKVRDALSLFDIDGNIDDDGKFVGNITSAIGKEFIAISYISDRLYNDKPTYKVWDNIKAKGKETELQIAFENSIFRGYPKDFAPDLLKADIIAKVEESKVSVSVPDDEAPF